MVCDFNDKLQRASICGYPGEKLYMGENKNQVA
jgi:hypothetical protein